MKVLVTGGTGLVGCHSAALLRERGHEVRLLVRNPAKIASSLGPLGVEKLDHVQGDVTDRDSVERALAGCDAVIHSAALFTLDRRREPEVRATNVIGTEYVLGSAARLGLDPIIYVSSVSALFPPEGERLGPDEPVKSPVDMYAASKAAAERVARRLQEQGVPVVCVYPGGIWGPNDPTLGDGVRVTIDLFKRGFLPSTSGGMPLCDVRDLAELHAALLEPGRGPRRYVAQGHFLAAGELGTLLARLTERRLFQPRLPGALMRGLGRVVDGVQGLSGVVLGPSYEAMLTLTHGVPCDDSRTREELGLVPRPPEETFRDTLRWMLSQGVLEPEHVGPLAG